MNHPQRDFFVVGNSIVDLVAQVDPETVLTAGLIPGGATGLDQEAMDRLLGLLDAPAVVAGGSGANSAAMASALGVPTGFIGCVGDDALGRAFSTAFEQAGVQPLLSVEACPTSCCISLVTPDGQRSMGARIGACRHMDPKALRSVPNDALLLVEAYLLPATPDMAMQAVARSGPTAVTLSDAGLVRRRRAAVWALCEKTQFILSNESEAMALTGAMTPTEAAHQLGQDRIAVVTCGKDGVVWYDHGQPGHQAAPPVKVVDTTGAGDAFAGGFLAAIASGYPTQQAVKTGIACAALVIQHVGARIDAKALRALRVRP